MQLDLARCSIRSYREKDAPALTAQAGTYGLARNVNLLPHPYSLRDAETWIALATSAQPETHFAIAIRDEVVGGIGLRLNDSARQGVFRHSAELGYWLG